MQTQNPSDRLDLLEAKLSELTAIVEKQPSRRFFAAEKLIVPIAVALLGFFTAYASNRISSASNRIAEAQVELARSQEARQAADAKLAHQLRYLDMFRSDIMSVEPGQQQLALSLLYGFEPEMSQTIVNALASSPGVDPGLRAQAEKMLVSVDRFGPLINYQLIIYYPRSNAQDAAFAADLRNRLLREEFPSDRVRLEPRDSLALDRMQYVKGYHLRYDSYFESEAADKLLAYLNSGHGERFRKVRTTGRTPGVLTIFVTS